jgi:HEPN domain-containing protein
MSNEKQETALEFYRHNLMELVSLRESKFKTENEIYEQAKEMHKEQIIDAYWHGYKNDIHLDDLREDDGEIWYNETYGGNK